MNEIKIYEHKGAIVPLFDNKKLELLKSTICKGSTDDEFELFLHACQRTGLDPFMRQIYSVHRWDGKLKRNRMTIQTGIDGYRLIAERTRKYSPGKETTYQYDKDGKLFSATSYIKKQTQDGTWHEIAATALFCEYCQKDKEGNTSRFWMQMGHTMLSKCAEALALRKAFPGDLSGLYTKEEMEQSEISGEDIIEINKKEKITEPIIEPISPQLNDNTPKTISHNEWIVLQRMVNDCDEDYQKTFWEYLTAEKIFNHSDMYEKKYFGLKKSIIKNIQDKKNESSIS